MATDTGLEPVLLSRQPSVIPIYQSAFILAERLGVEPSERLLVLQISNLLHYHPALAPSSTARSTGTTQ
jgi:hypothetical protein